MVQLRAFFSADLCSCEPPFQVKNYLQNIGLGLLANDLVWQKTMIWICVFFVDKKIWLTRHVNDSDTK